MPFEQMRERIDKIDSRILELLEERADTAKKIGVSKRKKGLPIEDLAREEEVLGRLCAKTKLNKKFVRKIFQDIINYCKDNE